MDHETEDDIWQIMTNDNKKTTNCSIPKYLLDQSLQSDQITLPLIFKVTNIMSNQYAICVADNFFETENECRLAKISPIIMNFLKITDIATIDLINNSPDMIPLKAKTVVFEPQDDLFYKLKDPQKTLEKCLKNSHIIGVDYLMPIELRIKTIYMRVAQIIDECGNDVNFANINNIDLNVDFLPLPEHLATNSKKPTNNVIRKKTVPSLNTSNNDQQTSHVQTSPQIQPSPQINAVQSSTDTPVRTVTPLYDPNKKWVPFCGWGYILSTGECVKGTQQE